MSSKGKKAGFTIIELLTVMSIIVVLISLLVPSLQAVRRYSRVVVQRSQFHDIDTGLEMFSIDFDGYPDSFDNVLIGEDDYCGAMKLCEAMLGQDGLGFHPDSRFRMDGTDGAAPPIDLYPLNPSAAQRRERKNPYIDLVNKYRICAMQDLYGSGNTVYYDPNSTVISDVFYRIQNQTGGEKLGMPVLYYKADIGKLGNDPNVANVDDNIYDFRDNDHLLELKVLGRVDTHPMDCNSLTADVFYKSILSKRVAGFDRPFNEDSHILISAGWDGLYGTRDDVYNFAE